MGCLLNCFTGTGTEDVASTIGPRRRNRLQRKKQAVPYFDPIQNASAFGPPPSLVSGEAQRRHRRVSALYLKWLPPMDGVQKAPKSPKVKYPTTRDMPAWIVVTPPPSETDFRKEASGDELTPPLLHGGHLTASGTAKATWEVRSDDRCVYGLGPSSPATKPRAPRVVVDASTTSATYAYTSTRRTRMVETPARYRGKGKGKSNPDMARSDSPTLGMYHASSSRTAATDVSGGVPKYVYSSTDTVSILEMESGANKTKGRLDKPLPPTPLPTVTPPTPRLPTLIRISSFTSTMEMLARVGVDGEDVRAQNSHVADTTRIGHEEQVLRITGGKAKAKRNVQVYVSKERSAWEALQTLERYDWLFEENRRRVEEMVLEARGTLVDLEQWDFFFE